MRILIAEDDFLARTFLESSLDSWGHEVIAASNGEEAWDILQGAEAPRIVILDWNMPKMDGVEVCRNIRSRQMVPYTYVILLTSKMLKEEIDSAYEAGVDDYLIKPFKEDQLQRRLRVGLRVVDYESKLSENRQQLEVYATQMEKLAEERGHQLAHAQRMATLGVLSAGIAHEINNPTTFIAGNAQVLNNFWPVLEESLKPLTSKDGGVISQQAIFILEETPKIIKSINNGVQRITKIVNGLKSYARHGDAQMKPCSINHIIEQALELCCNALKYHVQVQKELMNSPPEIFADAQQIEQVLVNLFVNSADAIGTKADGTLKIKTKLEETRLIIEIEDNGTGFPTKHLEKIWDPFFTTKEPGKGTGLGLAIIRGIVENHKGSITALNLDKGGARFSISLPIHGNK
ncbi:response regulator [bacterium]|nr:response regulator [bacterium]